ncbi:MAG: hypothetical protein Q4G34_00970 [Micrococcus sp.]|nr:hypothetical protein [Micrococcus sp.]
MKLRPRAARIAAMTTALLASTALAAPLTADAAANYRKIDQWERDWPGGSVHVEEIAHPRHPGWVEIVASGWIRDSGGRRAETHTLRCYDGLNVLPSVSLRSSRHRLGQITEGSFWIRHGRNYNCSFDRFGIRNDRMYHGRAG